MRQQTALRLGLTLPICLIAACAQPGPDDVTETPPDAGPDTGPEPDAGVPCVVPPFTSGVSVLAGCAAPGAVDGPRASARFANPVNVAYRDGTLIVADFDNDRLRSIDLASGVTTTLTVPTGFQRPFGLAFAADGTLYVSTDDDKDGNHSPMTGTIWRIDAATGAVTVVANAIGRPRGIAVLPDGRIAAADYQHHVVELVEPATGAVTVIAGAWDVPGYADGTAGRFDAPYGIAAAPDGSLLVADYGNHRLRSVALDGTASTLSGGASGHADGPLADARFDGPQALAIAADGTVFVTDTGNFRVRKIAAGEVTTVAGDGQGSFLDHDDPLSARLYGLEGVSVGPDAATLYVADGSRGEDLPYNRIRQIVLP